MEKPDVYYTNPLNNETENKQRPLIHLTNEEKERIAKKNAKMKSYVCCIYLLCCPCVCIRSCFVG